MAVTNRAFFYIQQVEQLVRQRLDQVLVPLGLTAGQYMALSTVAHHEPTTSAELARLCRITAQSMGEYIKILEQRHWIERREDPANKRLLLVATTPEGRKNLVRCEAAVDEAERDFFSCLKPDEIAHLRYALSRVRNAERARRAVA